MIKIKSKFSESELKNYLEIKKNYMESFEKIKNGTVDLGGII